MRHHWDLFFLHSNTSSVMYFCISEKLKAKGDED